MSRRFLLRLLSAGIVALLAIAVSPLGPAIGALAASLASNGTTQASFEFSDWVAFIPFVNRSIAPTPIPTPNIPTPTPIPNLPTPIPTPIPTAVPKPTANIPQGRAAIEVTLRSRPSRDLEISDIATYEFRVRNRGNASSAPFTLNFAFDTRLRIKSGKFAANRGDGVNGVERTDGATSFISIVFGAVSPGETRNGSLGLTPNRTRVRVGDTLGACGYYPCNRGDVRPRRSS